jgi:hypothetical protein
VGPKLVLPKVTRGGGWIGHANDRVDRKVQGGREELGELVGAIQPIIVVVVSVIVSVIVGTSLPNGHVLGRWHAQTDLRERLVLVPDNIGTVGSGSAKDQQYLVLEDDILALHGLTIGRFGKDHCMLHRTAGCNDKGVALGIATLHAATTTPTTTGGSEKIDLELAAGRGKGYFDGLLNQ